MTRIPYATLTTTTSCKAIRTADSARELWKGIVGGKLDLGSEMSKIRQLSSAPSFAEPVSLSLALDPYHCSLQPSTTEDGSGHCEQSLTYRTPTCPSTSTRPLVVTGQPREIEIWFAEHGGRFYLVAERASAIWVRNIQSQPQVKVRVATLNSTPSRASCTKDREPQLAASVKALFDAKYGWSDGLMVNSPPCRRHLLLGRLLKNAGRADTAKPKADEQRVSLEVRFAQIVLKNSV